MAAADSAPRHGRSAYRILLALRRSSSPAPFSTLARWRFRIALQIGHLRISDHDDLSLRWAFDPFDPESAGAINLRT